MLYMGGIQVFQCVFLHSACCAVYRCLVTLRVHFTQQRHLHVLGAKIRTWLRYPLPTVKSTTILINQIVIRASRSKTRRLCHDCLWRRVSLLGKIFKNSVYKEIYTAQHAEWRKTHWNTCTPPYTTCAGRPKNYPDLSFSQPMLLAMDNFLW